MKDRKNAPLVFVLPSLSSGGMERVMIELADYFSGKKEREIILLVLTKGQKFYTLPEKVTLIEPDFMHRNYPRPVFILKILLFLRRQLRAIKPGGVLSFGGKYNSFVLLAALGLGLRVFVSDRSRPSISYGKLQDTLNPVLYRKAAGIIAQTGRAHEVLTKRTNHRNIRVIGNPIRHIELDSHIQREKIVLNVGRFIESKKQNWLIDYFTETAPPDWDLYFLGEGPLFEKVKAHAARSASAHRIHFPGNVGDIDRWYQRASIFAFPTMSEGFPNALGEAMRAGMACISFDCEAGPADLIDHGSNGFLVTPGDHGDFKKRLSQLYEDPGLRAAFGARAQETIEEKCSPDRVGQQFYEFICAEE